MNKLMEKAIQSRNEQAIKKLVNLEAEKNWGKNNSLEKKERAEYFISLGKEFLRSKVKYLL